MAVALFTQIPFDDETSVDLLLNIVCEAPYQPDEYALPLLSVNAKELFLHVSPAYLTR